ncbi:MAG: hypothetical protein WCH04_19045 [Gammaproteobacteria bacterium]|jgi:hypothetical protein
MIKKSSLRGALLAAILAIIASSVNAREVITNNTDPYVLQNSTHHPFTTQAHGTDRSSQRVTAPGTLDIVFVLGTGLLGFLLLRKVNNS